MKVLIDNYTDYKTTEPLYISKTLQAINIENVLWDKSQMSFYDMMDRFQPDIFITSTNTLSNDVLHYFKHNKSSTDVVTNITEATEEDIRTLIQAYDTCNVNNKLLINNQAFRKPVNVPPSCNKQDIFYGADIFIQQFSHNFTSKIDLCVIVSGDVSEQWVQQVVDAKNPESYHVLSLDGKYQGKDANVSLVDMVNIYHMYKDISLISDKQAGLFTQLFFDLSLRGVDVNFSSLENVYNNELLKNMKNDVSQRHTCLNRVQFLLNKLGCKDHASVIDTLIGQLK